MRTTLALDAPVLKGLTRLQQRQGQSSGRLASDLLATALAQSRTLGPAVPTNFQWLARPMGERVDLADRDAVIDAIDAMDKMDGRFSTQPCLTASLYTRDRDFRKFGGLNVRDPLV